MSVYNISLLKIFSWGGVKTKKKLLTHPCIFFHFVCVIKIAYTVVLSILLLQHGGIGLT